MYFLANILLNFLLIYIDSLNVSRFRLQENKYIRGGFNLLSYMNIQSKTFYIELIGDKNYIINNDYILEFSSNLDSIKPIFNKEFNYSNIIESESSQKYYISKDNLEERKLYNFKIELDKTNNIIDFDAYKKDNLVSSNYIIKFYKKENYNSIDFIKNKDIVVERKSDAIEDYSRYNFTIKNKKKTKL